jgi:hypothetical protein
LTQVINRQVGDYLPIKSAIPREEKTMMTTSDSRQVWTAYPGNKLSTLALPDYYSNYIAYSFDASQQPHTGLCITGDFPNARYMSFNIYATKEGTSLGARTDYQITTQTPNGNPFVAGSRETPEQKCQYVVHVQPVSDSDDKRQKQSAQSAPQNLLTFDPNELKDGQLTVIIRYYVPQPDECGGVPLPTVEAYDINNPDQRLPLPEALPDRMLLHEPIFQHRMEPIFHSARGDELRFYHVAGGGQFNNADNIYLISAVKKVDGQDNVVILRVKPPTYPVTTDEFDQAIVRYWSFNQGDPDSSTPVGMRDAEFRPAKDGFVYIVMGNESFRDKAERSGYNFMLWKANKEQAVILYRNMLTIQQYRGSIARVPQLPQADRSSIVPWDEKLLVSHEASRHIGDYAPVGRKVTAQEFNDSCGGLRSPGFA